MEFTREDFYKLPQLDRLEYRQRAKLIKETYQGGYSLIPIKILLIILVFILLLLPQMYLAFGVEYVILIISKADIFIRVLIFLIPFGIVIDTVMIIIRIKESKRLNQEYFKIAVVNGVNKK